LGIGCIGEEGEGVQCVEVREEQLQEDSHHEKTNDYTISEIDGTVLRVCDLLYGPGFQTNGTLYE
jgi:hypothetical protein